MQFDDLTPELLEEAADIFILAFNAPPWNDSWTRETAQRRLRMMLDAPGSAGLLCRSDNGRAVGMILGIEEQYFDSVHFQIREFCVDPESHGGGVGTGLFEEFSRRLQMRGIEKLCLLTTRHNATEGYYIRRGFTSSPEMVWMFRPLQK